MKTRLWLMGCALLAPTLFGAAVETSEIITHCTFDEGPLPVIAADAGLSFKIRSDKCDLSTVAAADGVHGKALELKEGNRVKYVASEPAELQNLQPPFTIALWMKKRVDKQKHGIWLATATMAGPGGFELSWFWRRAVLRWGKGDENCIQSPTGLLFLGKWHHIAVTHDGKMITLYVDTLPVAQKPDNGNFKPVPEAKRKRFLPTLGQYPTSQNAYPHVGLLDDLWVVRRALTPEEISDLAVGAKRK